MNNNTSNLYNVNLLNDLHTYFPDLLYNLSRFESVQDVLGYIQTETRNRFNLYDRGLRDYNSGRQQRTNVVVEPTSSPETPHQGSCTCINCMPRTPPVRQRTTTTPPAPRRQPLRYSLLDPATFYFDIPPSMPSLEVSALNSLLNLATLPMGTTFINSMENVIVRPTEQQINAATTVFNMPTVSDISDNTCTVCQDAIEPEVPVRRITACGHRFHKECIDTWFERSVRCPVCRRDIRDS